MSRRLRERHRHDRRHQQQQPAAPHTDAASPVPPKPDTAPAPDLPPAAAAPDTADDAADELADLADLIDQVTRDRDPARVLPDGTRACPGHCNRRWRAAELAALSELVAAAVEHRPPNPGVVDHDLAPWPAAPEWCLDVAAEGDTTGRLAHTGCQTRIVRALRGIPALARHLVTHPLASTTNPDGTPAAGYATPSPSPAYDLLDELHRWADDLEAYVRDRAKEPPHTRPRPNVWASMGYLQGRASVLLAAPADTGEAADVLARHRMLQKVTGADQLVHRLGDPCPACGRLSVLQRRDGSDFVVCRACRAHWDWEQFPHLVRASRYVAEVGGGAG